MGSQNGPIKIDIRAVLNERLGRSASFIPKFLIHKLEDLICQNRLNELLQHNFPAEGAEFCKGVLNDLDVKVKIINKYRLPSPDKSRVIIVSNHPLGGLDGIALIKYFSEYYGGNLKFIVNDLLMAVKPLEPVFLPINKHGSQSRLSILNIDNVMASECPVIIFPSGLVSRQKFAGAPVADLEWKKMFVNKAIDFRRDIVPIFFDGKNSERFYSFARRREKSGLKFNLEMVLLPSEVFKASGKTFHINCGKTIQWQSLTGGNESAAEAMAIRNIVYKLGDELEHELSSKNTEDSI